MRSFRLIYLLFLSIIFVTACDEAPSGDKPRERDFGQPAYGDIMVRGDIGDASNLIPLLASDSPSHNIAGLVYNGLVKYDKDMKIIGDLAESWDISAGGLVITFHLRRGVKWHDGQPFTAAGVLFSSYIMVVM